MIAVIMTLTYFFYFNLKYFSAKFKKMFFNYNDVISMLDLVYLHDL